MQIGIVPPGESSAFLANLAVEDLPISTEMCRRLRLFGLRTAADLARLPQGAVAAQFGEEGARAWELAHGIDRKPVVPYRPPRSMSERLEFPAAVETSDVLVATTQRLIERALRRPELHGRAARGVTLRVTLGSPGRSSRPESGFSGARGLGGLPPTRSGGAPVPGAKPGAPSRWERTVTFREPVRSPKLMLTALKSRINSAVARGALGAFTEVELVLLDICGESSVQGRLFPSERSRSEHEQERLAEAARQLKARFGRPMLARVMAVEPWSRIPERRFALIDYDP
jgi:nucleotidyltransferase/DNA polymerase involved in DNA repair